MNEKEWVYIAEAVTQDVYKIGKSSDLERRLQELQAANHNEIKFIYQFQALNSYQAERSLHRLFGSKRIRGEWYRLDQIDLTFISLIVDTDYDLSFSRLSIIYQHNSSLRQDEQLIDKPKRVSRVFYSDYDGLSIQLLEHDITLFLELAHVNRDRGMGLGARYWVRDHKERPSWYRSLPCPQWYYAMIKLLNSVEANTGRRLLLPIGHGQLSLAVSPEDVLDIMITNLE